MLLVDRLDDLFSSPATDLLAPNVAFARPDEGPSPSGYMLSAQIITNDTTHSYLPVGAPYFSGGFVICHLNAEIVKYYKSLLMRDRSPAELAEQDFLNYAHRKEPMLRQKTIDGRRRGRVLWSTNSSDPAKDSETSSTRPAPSSLAGVLA